VLETRVNKLEKELEGKDTETDTLLRGVEQKYHNIKVGQHPAPGSGAEIPQHQGRPTPCSGEWSRNTTTSR